MAQPLDGVVIEVDVANFDLLRQGIRIDRVAVILRRDVHQARLEVLDRVVGAAMPELELESAAADCASHDLIA